MTGRPATICRLTHAPLVASILLLAAFGGCTSPEPRVPLFRNVGTGTAYTGDEACFSCHEEQYLGFQGHGMARSFYHDSTILRGRRPADTTLLHPGTGLSYHVFTVGDTLYQEEILPGRLPGERDNLRRKADFVMGSGNAARTYMAETNGRLFELPLTWYSQGNRWDFSPGYRIRNPRFSRQIPDRCMACHNGYPESAGSVDGKYASIPSGIGCERCHGPGALHVDERLAVPNPPGDFDDSIVDPALLDVDRRLDICQQCHLQTTVSVLRRGRGPFDFLPTEPLSDHVALFFSPDTRDADPAAVPVVSHGDRMRRSACFTATVEAEAPMECVTCHDPHAGFREEGPEYFNSVCLECHSVHSMADRVPSEAAATHTAEAHCFSCHMPRTEAEDAPHSSFTDHWIRVVSRTEDEPRHTSDEPLLPYFDQDRGTREGQTYLGMALVVQGRQAGDPQLMAAGVATIETGLQEDSEWAEASFLQGAAYLDLGRADLATEPLETAVRIKEDARYLDALARAFEAERKPATLVSGLYERALAVAPASFETRFHYAGHLQRNHQLDDAIEQYRRTLAEYPWHPEAHLMLGTALFPSSPHAAASAFKEAAILDPDLRDALSRVVVVNHSTGEVTTRSMLDGDAGIQHHEIHLKPISRRPDSTAHAGLRIRSGRLLEDARVFSSRGHLLRHIQISGGSSAVWDLCDASGTPVPSGLYLLRTTPSPGQLVRVAIISVS